MGPPFLAVPAHGEYLRNFQECQPIDARKMREQCLNVQQLHHLPQTNPSVRGLKYWLRAWRSKLTGGRPDAEISAALPGGDGAVDALLKSTTCSGGATPYRVARLKLPPETTKPRRGGRGSQSDVGFVRSVDISLTIP